VATEALDVFVSYARADWRHATDIDSILRARGLTSFFDRRNLPLGMPWVRELEKGLNAAKAAIILIGPQGFGNTQQYERDLAIFRQTRDRSFPIVPVILPEAAIDRPFDFLQILTWIDFSRVSKVTDAPAELDRLVEAIRGRTPLPTDEDLQAICPYRGLDAFREEDSMFFFGRGAPDDPKSAIGQLVAKVREHSFVVLVGRSGSGKSSLIYAGLIPALRRSHDRFWNILVLRPGPEPLRALAAAFNPRAKGVDLAEYVEKISAEAERLRTGDLELLSYMIREELDQSEGKPDRMLLYIDQWEELYAQVPSTSDASDKAARHTVDVNRFIDLLLVAAESAPVSIVATVRADFYDPLIGHQKIRALLPTQQVLLGSMSRIELESTIVEPAKLMALKFEPVNIVNRILDEAGEDEGMLPLLQFALKEAWKLREGGFITGDSYARSGGVREAIRLTADRKFNELSIDDQQAARRLFLRLVTPGEGQEDTRARAPMPAELAQRQIVEQFASPRTRLLVTGSDRAGRPTVEVAHEALIRTWPRLRQWIGDNREKLRERTAILRAKEAWEQNGKREDLLLPFGFQLERGRALVADPGDISIDDLRSYVETSIARQEKEEAEKLAIESRLKDLEIKEEKARADAAIARADAAIEKENRARKAESAARRVALISQAAVGVVALLIVVPLIGFQFFPHAIRTILPPTITRFLPPELPQRPPLKATYWLDQSWSNEERHWFHHASLGAALPVPYAWFVALEQPEFDLFARPKLLIDRDYLARLGFVSGPPSVEAAATAENPDDLPVGFARMTGSSEPATGAPLHDQIGLTCAACHVGHLEYKGVSLRFDGGPGIFDLTKLEQIIELAILYTSRVPGRFDRFATRVLGPEATENERSSLRSNLEETLNGLIELNNVATKSMIKRGAIATAEGFGRLDWLTRIGNQIFYIDIANGGIKGFERNAQPLQAPVSVPPLWTVPWFARTRMDGSSVNLIYNMASEALGASALTDFTGITNAGTKYRSTVAVENLAKVESLLRGSAFDGGLRSPKWPSDIFPNDSVWKIDPAKVERGRKIYSELCAECHLGPINDPKFDVQYPDLSYHNSANFREEPRDDQFLVPVQKSVVQIGTDPEEANIVATRKVAIPTFLDIDPARDLSGPLGCPNVAPTENSSVPFSLALRAVVERVMRKWLKDRSISQADSTAILGQRKDCPDSSPVPSYRARPLNGVWATAPYLHNGSVPSLYWLLKPARERPKRFCIGARDFDPWQVGLRVEPGEAQECVPGETLFTTINADGTPIVGNSNLGHSLERAPGPGKPGVIGREPTEDERFDLLEYLKTL
jgi:hypothetical protein